MASDAGEIERVVRTLFEVGFNTGNLPVIDEIVAPDFVEHQGGPTSGREELKGKIRHLRTWFPDLKLTIVDSVISGDTMWVRVVARATNTEPVMGKPPTGKPMQIDVIDICRVVDGKMVEHWGVADTLGMMEQVGVIPGR